jgi:outer membrane protein assembly factor BamB
LSNRVLVVPYFVIRQFWLALLLLGSVAADVWPQWRGPTRDGQVAGPDWPADLHAGRLDRAWRVPFGPSYSGPIVSETAVFTTETKDKQLEVVHALDRKTGRELWRREWEGAMTVPFFAKANGDWIRATPALDGDVLFVAGMRDVLVALDAGSGAVKWRRDFVAELKTPLPAFGNVPSPLVEGDGLYVQSGASVMRLNKATGEVVWRALENRDSMNASPFSSPVIATVAAQRQLIVQTRTELAGLGLDKGEVLWRRPVEAFRGMNILTPTVAGDRVFTSAYGGKTHAFEVRSESGKLTVAEAWQFKAQGYMCSPVLVDGHAYLHLRNNRALCLEVATGAEKWTTSESFGKYWNLVTRGDRILALDERGELLLFRANPAKFDLVDRRKVSDQEAWAHLALADGQMFIRDLGGLGAWTWRSAP